jgi:hypothetical protein
MYYSYKALAKTAKRFLGRPLYARRYEQMYRDIAGASKPVRTILEIGTNDGLNAERMVRAAKRSGADITYYGMDLFEEQTEFQFRQEFSLRTRTRAQVERYLRAAGITPVLVSGDSTALLPGLAREWPAMDVIFIDGGHSEATVRADWNNVQPLIGQHTLVFFDDYPNWGIKPVVDSIDTGKWDVTILPTTDRFRVRADEHGEANIAWRTFQIVRVKRKSS